MTTGSPFCYIGGKHYLAKKIVAYFPAPESYEVYLEPFGGAGHVLMTKPTNKHIEYFNDYNRDLVNCWMHIVEQPEDMAAVLDSLPYSRALHKAWHTSLFDGTELSAFDRAVRWFYVLRGSARAEVSARYNGWKVSNGQNSNRARVFHQSLDRFAGVADRFAAVHIECRDFAELLRLHQRANVFIYADPPYIGYERYYRQRESFTFERHRELAALLNAHPGPVALSYYPHACLDDWYPAPKWRRLTFTALKHTDITLSTPNRAVVTELLLVNYGEVCEQEAA